MPDDNFTIKKLLDDDALKALADRIISEDIDHIILIYRDKENNCIHWETTVKDWATLIGSLSMVDTLMHREWLGEDCEDE